MRALVNVDGRDFPEPSTYNATTSTIVDSARNVAGYVIGSVIRSDVAKIELSWRYLTAKQWSDIIRPFAENFFCEVTFWDQTIADYSTRKMYVSDRQSGLWRRDPDSGAIMGYTNCALSLVEV